MPTIYIDNQPYTIDDEQQDLLTVCLSLGFNLPYFCWHPALHSVGACRQCAVKQFKDAQDTRGRLVMACMTPAKDGTRISIDDPEAVAFRKGITEWMMTNHPHDCPVCDEGGECHLQDMTVMTGHVYRRFRFKKRSYRNQDLGPFVNHEMNRCIECYRCVRFYRDFAGGHDFDVFGWHDSLYFGRHEDGVLASEFSGNLVEVCPTGVFTDKTLKEHYTRKWDLQTAPSICVHCGLGCNIIPGERYGLLRRIHNRYHGEVNGYFLCDRGRYGYEFVNSEQRLRRPLLRSGDTLREESRETVFSHLAGMLKAGNIIGIGSPRASLEANYALRALVGAKHFYHGISNKQFDLLRGMLQMLRSLPLRTPAQQEIARADAVLLLGEDVSNVAPMLALALRQAVLQGPRETLVPALQLPPFDEAGVREAIQAQRGPLFIITPGETRLDAQATATLRATPEDAARLGFAIAHLLDSRAPNVPDLPAATRELAAQIAHALQAAKRPLVIAGPSLGCLALPQAAANVALAVQHSGVACALAFTTPACNSLGLAMLEGSGAIDEALAALRGGMETVLVLENDLYQQVETTSAKTLFTLAKHVVTLDTLRNATVEQAEIVLPAATFAESDGSLVNNEGRAQRFVQVFVPGGEIRASWQWLGELQPLAGLAPANPWPSLDDLLTEMAHTLPAFATLPEIAPSANFRMDGQRIPRQPARYSGRTAISANIDVHEAPPPPDPNTPLSFSMEGYSNQPPAALIARFWSPGWNSVQALNKFQQEVGGPLRGGDPGRRLLEPPSAGKSSYFTQIPPAFVPRQDEWYVLPAYHYFGSEELSLHTPGIARLAPRPYLGVCEEDLARLRLTEGSHAVLIVDKQVYELRALIVPSLPAGVVTVPIGLPGVRGVPFPAWGRVEAVR